MYWPTVKNRARGGLELPFSVESSSAYRHSTMKLKCSYLVCANMAVWTWGVCDAEQQRRIGLDGRAYLLCIDETSQAMRQTDGKLMRSYLRNDAQHSSSHSNVLRHTPVI